LIKDGPNKGGAKLLLSFGNRRLKLTRSKKQIAIACLATQVVTLGLAGCAGKIHYPSYYVLSVPAPVSAQVPEKGVVGAVAVKEFSAPSFLRTGTIAYHPSPEQLNFYDYHRWAEDPRRVVTTAMVRQMQAHGRFRSVDIFDGRETPDYLVTGTVDHLEEFDQGTNVSVEVGLSARLVSLRTGAVLWQDSIDRTANLDKRSVPGLVAAMSRELGNAVEGLSSSMDIRLRTNKSEE
jgi:ABC-type uncharacterized transport system auxiliary subunit